jgi:hypothetical protein
VGDEFIVTTSACTAAMVPAFETEVSLPISLHASASSSAHYGTTTPIPHNHNSFSHTKHRPDRPSPVSTHWQDEVDEFRTVRT